MLSGILAAVGITAVVSLLFLVYIHVIWCLADCAVADAFDKGTKIRWVIFLSFTGCFGAFLYSFFATPSKVLRGVTVFATLAVLIAIPAFYYYGGGNNATTTTQPAAKSTARVKHLPKHAVKAVHKQPVDIDD